MIFLKKLFHRPVESKKKGSITVWLTLSFLVFLGLLIDLFKNRIQQCPDLFLENDHQSNEHHHKIQYLPRNA